MPRTRTIRPNFWNDEKLANISRDARLTFIGIWTTSDDYGTVKGHPVWLKNQIFPYDEIKKDTFNKWLKELEKTNCILPFEHNGEKYYFIRTFNDHQKVDKPSLIRNPEPPSNIRETVASESREPIDEIKLNKIKEKEIKENINSMFDQFWEEYPRKVGSKPKAKEYFINKYKESKLNGEFIKLLLNAVKLQKRSKQWKDPQYIPYPTTWLNGKRWNDEFVVEETLAEKSARLTSELAKEDGNGDIFG